jgi:N-acetylmuramoyl-L-alanine amidase
MVTKYRNIISYKKVISTILLLFIISSHFYSQGYEVKTIVIDAGHGGKDPGAVGRKGKEKDINLAVALLTGNYIEKYIPDVKVIYTRKTDVAVDLKKRSEIANKNKADLFISIHTNAVPNSKVTGASTWLLGVSKNQSNLEMAKLENSVIELEENYEEKYQGFDPNKDESYIIFSFNATKAYFEQSLSLAQELQNQFSTRVGRRNYGIQQGPFWVLLGTTMPSVLIELGFITNPKEESFLLSKEGQEYMASAIFRSVRDYKKQIESKNKKAVIVSNPIIETKKPVSEKQISTPSVQGVSYKIQFLLSTKKIELNAPAFSGIPDVMFYQDGSYYKYTSGAYTDIDIAKSELKNLKKKYPDAFIVAFNMDKRISIAEAKRLLKQD